jgi:anti-sigma factor RsiW
VDDSGEAVWLVDPGINGVHTTRPDGTEVRKFDAPKATLVSYIIKGILDREAAVGAGAAGRDDRVTLQFCPLCPRWRLRWVRTCPSRPRRRSSSAA